jgi:hypothetical protein
MGRRLYPENTRYYLASGSKHSGVLRQQGARREMKYVAAQRLLARMSHIKVDACWPHFSNMKMEVANSFETFVNFYQTMRRNIPDDNTFPNNISCQWDGEMIVNGMELEKGKLYLRYTLNFEFNY